MNRRSSQAVEQSVIAQMDGGNVTVSIGLHVYGKDDNKESLFRSADTALYEAKRGGKNRTILKFHPDFKSSFSANPSSFTSTMVLFCPFE